jgi:hypothetical protein
MRVILGYAVCVAQTNESQKSTGTRCRIISAANCCKAKKGNNRSTAEIDAGALKSLPPRFLLGATGAMPEHRPYMSLRN